MAQLIFIIVILVVIHNYKEETRRRKQRENGTSGQPVKTAVPRPKAQKKTASAKPNKPQKKKQKKGASIQDILNENKRKQELKEAQLRQQQEQRKREEELRKKEEKRREQLRKEEERRRKEAADMAASPKIEIQFEQAAKEGRPTAQTVKNAIKAQEEKKQEFVIEHYLDPLTAPFYPGNEKKEENGFHVDDYLLPTMSSFYEKICPW